MSGFSNLYRIVGEIVIIVVGILLALAADTWMSEREHRQKEVEHLSAILHDLNKSLVDLRSAIDFKTQQIADIQLLLNVGAQGVESDVFREIFTRGVYVTSPYVPSLSALRDLEVSGNIGLISDPVIRRGLSLLNTRLQGADRSLQEYITFHQTDLDPFIARSLPVVGILSDYSGAPVDVSGEDDWSPLDSDMARGLLVFKMSLVANYIKVLERLAEQLEFLIDKIRAVLHERA